jgi:hypothetical protein
MVVMETVIEGAAVFVGGLAAVSLCFTAAYGYHILRRIDQSATETGMTETTTTTQNKVP